MQHCAQWNNRPMDQLRAMRVFARVITEGSFAGAARALDMAPAVVTRVLAELEAHLGARLLNRTTRRIALTEIGQEYLNRARRILAEIDDADALAGAATTQPRGPLRVLCPPAFAVHQLARHLPAFRARFPAVELEIATPGPVQAADEDFDVSVVSAGAQPLQGEFIARPLACSAFLICAAPAYLQRRGRPQSPDDLLQHDALLPAVTALRRELTLFPVNSEPQRVSPQKELPPLPRAGEGWGEGCRPAQGGRQPAPPAQGSVSIPLPAPALSTPHLELLHAAALAGLGLAGLPSFIAADALRDGRLEHVLPQWRGAMLTLYAAMPTRQHVPARTRAFVDFLVQTFGGKLHDPWWPHARRPAR
jgi:DNA-binding transcriptional LysR family regulator